MILLHQSIIEKKQNELVQHLRSKFSNYFDSAEDVLKTYVVNNSDLKIECQNIDVILKKLSDIATAQKQGVELLLLYARQVYSRKHRELDSYSVVLSDGNKGDLFKTLVEILLAGRDLEEDDYYFLSRVMQGIELDTKEARKLIEQAQNSKRKEMITALKDYLTEDQRFLCALMIYKAINADQDIHPEEFKYFQSINLFLDNDLSKLELIEQDSRNVKEMPSMQLNSELAEAVFVFLVEIVLCDQHFDQSESSFLDDAAKVLGVSEFLTVEVEQIIADALVTKEALFPK